MHAIGEGELLVTCDSLRAFKMAKRQVKSILSKKPASVSSKRAAPASSAPSKRQATKKSNPDEADARGADGSGKRYWLFKSEPNPRIEKGVDVSFPLSKLQEIGVDGWDGVRNYQARNLMRDEMRIGDEAFFYHSSCANPGVVGVVEVVKEGYPDETAFDPKDPHYDPKSSEDNPRWFQVDVQFKRATKRLISLKELKPYGEGGGPLSGMALLNRSRLSVQPVRPNEWEFVLGLEDQEGEEEG